MKAKPNIPEVPQLPQAAPAPTVPQEPPYKELSLIEALMPFLGGPDTPSVDDCENTNRNAFNSACALVELVAWGEEALQNEAGNPTEPMLTRAAEGIILQLEIMRLASKTQFDLFQGDRFAHKPR